MTTYNNVTNGGRLIMLTLTALVINALLQWGILIYILTALYYGGQ